MVFAYRGDVCILAVVQAIKAFRGVMINKMSRLATNVVSGNELARRSRGRKAGVVNGYRMPAAIKINVEHRRWAFWRLYDDDIAAQRTGKSCGKRRARGKRKLLLSRVGVMSASAALHAHGSGWKGERPPARAVRVGAYIFKNRAGEGGNRGRRRPGRAIESARLEAVMAIARALSLPRRRDGVLRAR